MKILVKFFSDIQIENAASALIYEPEGILFFGDGKTMTGPRKNALRAFFEMRGLSVKTEFVTVGRYDYGEIISLLNTTVSKIGDCVFDLTGAREHSAAAMGAVSAEKNIPMIRTDAKRGDTYTVSGSIEQPSVELLPVTVEQSVALNGGAVLTDEPDEFTWDFSADFCNDVENMWDICRENCGLWNKCSSILGSFENFGRLQDKQTVLPDESCIQSNRRDMKALEETVKKLVSIGIITDYSFADGEAFVRYKNEQIRRAVNKAGNLLELYTYILLSELMREKGRIYSLDIGVHLDWDGVKSGSYDTKNEVDVLYMRRLNPVYISCKNGAFKKEALYELDTVAEHYGGRYASRVLVATYIDSDEDSKNYVIRRAGDMKIRLIGDVHKMTREEFKKALDS